MSNPGKKGKSPIIWVLMGLLLVGLGGFGIENFAGGGSEVGKVGNVTITSDDYARSVRQEMQGFAQQTGRQISSAEAQEVGLHRNVLARLFLAASMEEQARTLGVSVGDETVGRALMDAPAFQGLTGRFDSARYQQILRDEGLTVRQFEHDMRMDEARMILQQAVISGAPAPSAMVNRTVDWLMETRDIRWHELTAEELATPVATPDEETLKAWHQANSDRFTAPEIRKLSYVWTSPDLLEDKVSLDEQALRDLYEDRIGEFRKPERRLVERLVFQSDEAANAARARLDSGEIGFEQLAAERGLSLADIDEGEVTREQLGPLGDAVFALEQPGIVGPLATDLGPALFSMNAILEPLDVPFEEARAELRGEAALDRARRQIDEMRTDIDDRLAGGALLQELAADTGLELGQIDWRADQQPEQGSIAGYPAFRSEALAITPEDFPELHDLDDGGVFVLQLDEIVPPSLIPFDEIRDRVAEDWTASETHRQLLALAEERRVNAVAQGMQPAPPREESAPPVPSATPGQAAGRPNPAPVPGAASPRAASTAAATVVQAQLEWQKVDNLPRDGFIEGTPEQLVGAAFGLSEVGESEVVDASNRVFLVTLDAIDPVDSTSDQTRTVRDGVSARLRDSIRQDLFEYYARAIQAAQGMTINQAAIDAVNSRM